jgi:hypothetical protein
MRRRSDDAKRMTNADVAGRLDPVITAGRGNLALDRPG